MALERLYWYGGSWLDGWVVEGKDEVEATVVDEEEEEEDVKKEG